jgi:hypothetical protein
LCDNALITGFGYQRNPVGEKIIKEVIVDFRGRGRESRRISRVWPVAAVCAGIILIAFFFTKPLDNQMSREVPHSLANEEVKDAVKSVPSPAPSVDPGVPQNVPVSGENSNVEQRIVEFEPPAKIESVPEHKDPPLPEKQPLREEPAEKITDVPKREPLFATAPSDRPKDKGWSTRIVVKGDNITNVLLDTYGYYDAGLMELFKEANPQIKNVDKIEVGEELQLPRLSSRKDRAR